MPQIRPYESQVQAQGPVGGAQATAADFGGLEAQGLANIGAGVSDVGDMLERRANQIEVSDLHAKTAQAQMHWTQWLSDRVRKAQPGDDVTGAFTGAYDDYMANIEDGIHTNAGRDYFNKANQILKKNLFEQAIHGEAQLAGAKAQQDYTVSLNALSAASVSNPASYDANISLLRQGLQSQVESGQLSQKDAIALETDGRSAIAKSTVMGMININPEAAKKELASGRFDSALNGLEIEALNGHADTAIRGADAEQARIDAAKEKALKLERDNLMVDFNKKIEANSLSVKDVLNSKLDAEQQRLYVKMIKTNAEEKISYTDPIVGRKIISDIMTGKLIDDKEILKFAADGKISMPYASQMMKLLEGNETEAGRSENQLKAGLLKIAEKQLDKSDPTIGKVDPKGAALAQSFNSWFLEEYPKRRAQGISAHDLLTPPKDGEKANPNYMGLELEQPGYQRTPQEKIKDIYGGAQKTQIATTPQAPEESHPPMAQKGKDGKTYIYHWNPTTKKYE